MPAEHLPTQEGFAPGDPSDTERSARLATEIEVLRGLCSAEASQGQKHELVRVLGDYFFIEPEHQIVFESIALLHQKRELSLPLLAVHLNNRGFPDIGLEKYFVAAPQKMETALRRARELSASKPSRKY
jgi:hypothetical protein